jgi:hypothetical protein
MVALRSAVAFFSAAMASDFASEAFCFDEMIASYSSFLAFSALQ